MIGAAAMTEAVMVAKATKQMSVAESLRINNVLFVSTNYHRFNQRSWSYDGDVGDSMHTVQS